MSTVDRVQASVMHDLLRGELAPGTWLRQDELAGRLGVSKIPVREALHRLAGLGLLRFEANRGAVVPVLTAAEAEEIFALRRGVEPTLLRRAGPRLSIVDLAEAQLVLDGPGGTAGDGRAPGESGTGGGTRIGRDRPDPGERPATEANWVFHRSLYRASGWHRGLALAEILHTTVAPYVRLYVEDLGGAAGSDAEHRAILDACRNGAIDTAVELLTGHLDAAAAALVGFLEGAGSRDPAS